MSKKQRAGCRVNRASRRITARYCHVDARQCRACRANFTRPLADRFHHIGGLWVENDADMFSGGGLAHQFIVGQRYFQDKFGARSASVCLWLLVSGRLLREDNVSGSMAPDMYAATIGNVDRAVANHTDLLKKPDTAWLPRQCRVTCRASARRCRVNARQHRVNARQYRAGARQRRVNTATAASTPRCLSMFWHVVNV
ncbi:hypothetical protein C8R44DRAFT_881305 [Mycena epipterygia]|nr:hypothetical protein C8R44DRAFT_881305 [Mycena epipterygia]